MISYHGHVAYLQQMIFSHVHDHDDGGDDGLNQLLGQRLFAYSLSSFLLVLYDDGDHVHDHGDDGHGQDLVLQHEVNGNVNDHMEEDHYE